eukprot:scaffold2854_cov116-Isochrysis_galbana.AAC.9
MSAAVPPANERRRGRSACVATPTYALPVSGSSTAFLLSEALASTTGAACATSVACSGHFAAFPISEGLASTTNDACA